jgi:Carbohydrate-selective porin, OprB family
MSSRLWKSIYVSPIVLGLSVLLSSGVMAAPKSTEISPTTSGDAKDLILNKASGANAVKVAAGEPTPATSEVSNGIVKPGDWQYTALQDLSTKYGCNPNFNNQPVLAIEFARGLNTCINRVETSLALQQKPRPVVPVQSVPPAPPAPTVQPNAVTQEDLEVLKRLTQEFRAQLTEIDNKIVAGDKKIAQVQATQFSTTTKLKGEAVFNVSGVASGATQNNTIFGDRVRLLFESSFTGKDRLWTRIATGNSASLGDTFNVPSNTGAQVIDSTGGLVTPTTPNNNTTGIDWLAYQFPVGNANVYVAAFNALQVDYAPSFAPNFDDFSGASGAISAFAESSPIYKIGGGSGVGATIPVSDTGLASVSVGYFAFGANSPATNSGLFGQDNSLFGQLNFKFSPQLEGGVTYINSSHSTSIFNGTGVVVGTPLANTAPGRTTANSYGLALAYKASDKLTLNGFAMRTDANKGALGRQEIWSYGGGVAFPDIDGKGGLAGLFVGAEPYVGGAGSTPLHLEGFYKYKLSDNLSITPGLIYLTNTTEAGGNSALIGVVRSTFLF